MKANKVFKLQVTVDYEIWGNGRINANLYDTIFSDYVNLINTEAIKDNLSKIIKSLSKMSKLHMITVDGLMHNYEGNRQPEILTSYRYINNDGILKKSVFKNGKYNIDNGWPVDDKEIYIQIDELKDILNRKFIEYLKASNI